MSGTAIATMIVICGVVWGGFALLLTRAVRHEGRKRDETGEGDEPGASGGG